MKILVRKRLRRVQKEMSQFSFTYIYAPWGYGKTTWKQALCNDFRKQQKFVEEVSSYEAIDIKKYRTSLQESYIILDNVGGELPDALKQPLPSHLHIIIFHEQEPDPFFYHLIKDKVCLWVESKTLLFNKSEILSLWQLHQKNLSIQELEQLILDTNGWACALMLHLEGYTDLQTLSFMKEAYIHSLTQATHRFLCKLAVAPSFTKEQAVYITRDTSTHDILKKLEHTCGFLRKTKDTYHFLPIFRDAFLNDMHLFHMPKMLYYKRCAQWFEMQKQYLNAFHLYFELRDFEHIYEMVENCDFYLLDELGESTIICCLEISKKISITYPHAYLCFLCYYIFYINAEKGNQYLQAFKKTIKANLTEPMYSTVLGETYICESYLYIDDIPLCGLYNFKAYELLDGKIYNRFNSYLLKTSGSYQVLFQYYKKIGTFSSMYIELHQRAIMYHEMTNFSNTAFVCQLEAEYAYENAEYSQAIIYAQKALQCVDRKREFSLYIAALFTMGKASILEQNDAIFHSVIKEIYQLSLTTSINRMKGMVLCVQAQLALMSNHPEWINASFEHLDEQEFYGTFACNIQKYITIGKVAIAKKNAVTLRQLILPLSKFHNSSTYVFVSLYVRLFKIFLMLENGPLQARQMLRMMLEQTEKDSITSFYLEFSFELYPLLQSLDKTPYIQDILDKMTQVLSFHQKSEILYTSLTPKEYQVYLYWREGKSREEIAELMAVSINTVKYHLKNIYKSFNIHQQRDLLKDTTKQINPFTISEEFTD